jgi:hypothetical protein
VRYQYGNYYNSISKKDICLVRGDLISSRLFLGYCYDNIYPYHHYVYLLGHCNNGSTPNRIGICANRLHPESSQLTFMETILKQNPALVDILDLFPMILLFVGGLIIVWLFLHNNLTRVRLLILPWQGL